MRLECEMCVVREKEAEPSTTGALGLRVQRRRWIPAGIGAKDEMVLRVADRLTCVTP